jgi:hypothetical protein
LIANALRSSISTCDGNGLGYISGEKDTTHEPLLNIKGIGPSNSGDPASVNQPPTADSKNFMMNINTALPYLVMILRMIR